jgi:uncharacterized protein involved in exopolysaccharide biosynthesis
VKLLQNLSAEHPDVVALDRKIATEKAQLEKLSHLIVEGMRTREVALKRLLVDIDKQIAAPQKEVIELAAKLAENERLQEEFKAAKLAHDTLAERAKQAQNFQNKATDYVAIMDRASDAYMETTNRGFPIWKLWSKSVAPALK